MSGFVPASTKVRRSRVRHVSTSRLHRRAAYLRRVVYHEARTFRSRMDWAHRALELYVIDRELERRRG